MAFTCERFSRIMQINLAIKDVIHEDFSLASRMFSIPSAVIKVVLFEREESTTQKD